MNTALRKQTTVLRTLFGKASSDEIRTRYRIAELLRSIQDTPNKYGSYAFAELAKELDCDRTTLFRYAQVAKNIDRKTLETLLRACARTRRMTSWWHLIVVASAPRADMRMLLLAKLPTGISVRELVQIARGQDAEPRSSKDASITALKSLLTVTENLKGRASIEIEIDVATPEALELLGDVIDSQEELREICERNVRALRQQRTELQRRRLAVVERLPSPLLMG